MASSISDFFNSLFLDDSSLTVTKNTIGKVEDGNIEFTDDLNNENVVRISSLSAILNNFGPNEALALGLSLISPINLMANTTGVSMFMMPVVSTLTGPNPIRLDSASTESYPLPKTDTSLVYFQRLLKSYTAFFTSFDSDSLPENVTAGYKSYLHSTTMGIAAVQSAVSFSTIFSGNIYGGIYNTLLGVLGVKFP
jgi:hypothetical protein